MPPQQCEHALDGLETNAMPMDDDSQYTAAILVMQGDLQFALQQWCPAAISYHLALQAEPAYGGALGGLAEAYVFLHRPCQALAADRQYQQWQATALKDAAQTYPRGQFMPTSGDQALAQHVAAVQPRGGC